MNVTYEKRSYLGVDVVLSSERFRMLLRQAEQVAVTDAAVLITGESGTGKELIARAIHHHSRRRSNSWVDINCTALPENLLESELFGYERGAFSGADSSKPGLFELANNGTLFLDEIGEFDRRLQVKLLRVLDGAPYYRLGGLKKVQVDVRLVTATNLDLKTAVEQGKFRPDLYHRLSQVRLWIPPLRERPDDVAPLALHFLGLHKPGLRISREAMDALEAYSWPGNVRELRNAIVRAAVFAQNDEIRGGIFPKSCAMTPSHPASPTCRCWGRWKETRLSASWRRPEAIRCGPPKSWGYQDGRYSAESSPTASRWNAARPCGSNAMAGHSVERRQAPRFPATGRVEILIEDPVPVVVEAELQETSARGFRISHHGNQLVPGLEVRLRRDGAVLPARVIWTHILDGRSVSGCMLL